MVEYREHMGQSLGLEICWKMEKKIDEPYHTLTGKPGGGGGGALKEFLGGDVPLGTWNP